MSGARAAALAGLLAVVLSAAQPNDSWLTWSAKQAQTIGQSTLQRGRVAGGRRLLNTERARSYKLVATWFTPEVIRASARVIQIGSRYNNRQTEALVAEAESQDRTVVMIELDPDEGSGVIPAGWEAFLRPSEGLDREVAGTLMPSLRDVKLFAGVSARNYDYDRFWVVFPTNTTSGENLFRSTDKEAELIVRIRDREGRVRWPIPVSARGT